MSERIRYCPKCGRVTEDEIVKTIGRRGWRNNCDDCWRWLMRMHPFTAKRTGES
jgi:hypothetical protein